MPTWVSIYFQNASSPVIEQLIFFHDHTIFVIIIIIVLVGYILIRSILNKQYNRIMFEGQELERVWTVLPVVFLLMIAFPSLRLLYLIEEIEDSELTIKVIGHQWYWSYEYRDIGDLGFEAYIVSRDENPMSRLLNVDNSLVIPYFTRVRVITSSRDVIHSWTIPSLGVKSDAIPGRLNQILILFNRVGLYVGQCSEICGANHRFIPILISVIPRLEFLRWI